MTLNIVRMTEKMANRWEIFGNKISIKSAKEVAVILSKAKCKQSIETVLVAKSNQKRDSKSYWLRKRYGILEVSVLKIIQ